MTEDWSGPATAAPCTWLVARICVRASRGWPKSGVYVYIYTYNTICARGASEVAAPFMHRSECNFAHHLNFIIDINIKRKLWHIKCDTNLLQAATPPVRLSILDYIVHRCTWEAGASELPCEGHYGNDVLGRLTAITQPPMLLKKPSLPPSTSHVAPWQRPIDQSW